MKKIVSTVSLLFAAFALCLVPFLSPAVARAGSSETTVADRSSYSSGIDGATWLNFGQVKGENGKIIFDDDVKENGRLVAATKIQDYSDCGMPEIFNAEYGITITDIPEEKGSRFGVAYGLNDMEDKLGAAGSTEIYFVKSEGALKVGISRYSADGEVKIVEPTAFDGITFGNRFTLNVTLDSDSVMNATVSASGGAKKVLADKSNPLNFAHSTEGYTAIGQNGKCAAEVSSVNIKAYRYFNAETPLEITENFDNGHYNRNAFFTRSQMDDAKGYAGGCYVKDGALKFDVLSSFISTVYHYSNFELTFDLVDVQRENVLDNNGNVQTPAVNDSWLGISFGSEENRGTFDNHMRNANVLTMSGKESSYRMWTPYPNRTELFNYPEAYKTPEMQILSKDNAGKVYNYKVAMKDGLFTASYKLSTEENYPAVPLVSYDLGYTPYGSVAIIAYVFTGYTIDNIKIVNTDYAPQEVTISYEENGMKQTEDFNYEDKWSDSDLVSVSENGSGCSSAFGVSGYAAVIALALCAAVALKALKRVKKREE